MFLINLILSASFLSIGIDGCSYTGANSPTANTRRPADPAVNKTQPPAVASTCGHSKYFHLKDLPGAGIVGGVTAAKNQYPWLVTLNYQGSNFCGGSIISESHVITAAHCASGVSVRSLAVVVGEHDLRKVDEGQFTVGVSAIYIHPQYRDRSDDYDFAILKLSQKLNFTNDWNVQKICLPESCSEECDTYGQTVFIAGWGTLRSGGSIPSLLQHAAVIIGDQNYCKQTFDGGITERMLCAGNLNGGIDTCQGDSGGPLMAWSSGYFKLCGITSFGEGCAEPNYYGVYSRVCNQITWIKSIMK